MGGRRNETVGDNVLFVPASTAATKRAREMMDRLILIGLLG